MPNADPRAFYEAMQRLRETFASQLPERLAQLEAAAEAAIAAGSEADVRAALARVAAASHSLAGTGGSFGYSAVSEESAALEQLCRTLTPSSALSHAEKQKIENLVSRVRHASSRPDPAAA